MKFVLDATFAPKLAAGLKALSEGDVDYDYAPDLFGAEAPDTEIYPGVQKLGASLVTLDIKMTRKPQERAAMKAAGVGVFAFTGRALAQKSFREIAAAVLAVSDEMVSKAKLSKPPFIWGISDQRKFQRLDED